MSNSFKDAIRVIIRIFIMKTYLDNDLNITLCLDSNHTLYIVNNKKII